MSHHHNHTARLTSINGIVIFSVVLNLSFVLVEAVVGWTQNSLSLLSDAGHNLGDVFSLVLVLIAFRLSKIQKNDRFTYGYKKSSILISLLNAVLLLIAVGAIIIESIHKFRNPVPVNGVAVSWVAGVGVVINGLTTFLLMRGKDADLNVRGAFLHMLADTLVSVGVVLSGIVITYTGWMYIDPVMSWVVSAVIIVSTWHLFAASMRLSIDGMPEGLSLKQVQAAIEEEPHVSSAYHIHVWAMSTTENALTAHVVIDDLQHMPLAKTNIKHRLATLGIPHSTLEFETKDDNL